MTATWEVGRIAAVSASVEQAVRRVRGELEMLRESGRAVPRRVTIEVKVLDCGQYLAKVVGPWVEPDRPSPRRRAVSHRRQAATRPEGRKDDEAAA